MDIILGAHNLTADEDTQVRVSASEIHIHQDYNSIDYQNDIALLKLAEEVTLNDYIQTVHLPSRSDVNKTYEYITVTSIGWGLTGDVNYIPTLRDISPVLKFVQVAVQPLPDCEKYYNNNSLNITTFVTELNICTTGHKNKGTCRGDSGGPLILKDLQIGLVSIGSTLCEQCSPSVFTKIAKHLDWIEQHSDIVIN